MFNSPEIHTSKINLDNSIACAIKHKPNSHSAIKVQSLLNITVYVLTCRFLEGAVKHIVYNCLVMKGLSQEGLDDLSVRLKKFNNPEFNKIRALIMEELGYDIAQDKNTGYSQSDITFLNELCNNRHRNVHATEDHRDWYDSNRKNMSDFNKEYQGLINVVSYLDNLHYDTASNSYTYQPQR